MPFFSIIVPLFNKENFIENTLRSIFSQSFIDFELLIINDGSTDKSEEKVKQFSDDRIRYFYKENEGVATTRNFGIAQAKSQYISFIDADDYWYPTFLQEMYQNIHQFPGQKIFSCAIEIETQKNRIPAQYSILKKSDCQIVNYFESSMKTTVICTSAAVFNKSVFEKAGNFEEQLQSGEDTDLWIRIGLLYSVVFSWKILARYVYDKNSLSKNRNAFAPQLDFNKFQDAEKNIPELKKFLDYNRFSFAIKSKLNADDINFNHFYKAIDLKSLSRKRKILLQLPGSTLKILIWFNVFLVRIGLCNSVFK